MKKEYTDTIINLINDDLNWSFLKKNICNERTEAEKHAPVSYPKYYDQYSYLDYINFYKMNRLYELNKITKKEQILLSTLYNIKLDLDKKLGKLLLDDVRNNTFSSEKEKELLENEISRIVKILLKYNILVTNNPYSDLKIDEVIDSVISTEDYTNKPGDIELASFVRTLKI